MQAQCCFCAQTITEGALSGVTLRILIPDGGEQQIFCHASCLERSLHPSVPLAVEATVSEEMANGLEPTALIIPISEATAAVLASAVEDDFGLYETVWELNTLYPQASLSEKYRAAVWAVEQLLWRGWISLYRLGNSPDQSADSRELLDLPAAIEVLGNPVSWYPEHGGNRILIAATETGIQQYNSGDAA